MILKEGCTYVIYQPCCHEFFVMDVLRNFNRITYIARFERQRRGKLEYVTGMIDQENLKQLEVLGVL